MQVSNGAHIVLAAWQAGLPLAVEDGSASPAASNSSSSSTAASTTAAAVVTSAPGGSAPAAAAAAAQDEVSCVLGRAAAAAAGLTNSTGPPDSPACAAALEHLFTEALAPLDKAGVLLVTLGMPGSESVAAASGSAAAGDDSDSHMSPPPQLSALPCALAGRFSTVLCVNAEDAAADHDLADSVSAETYFEALNPEPEGFGASSDSSSTPGPGSSKPPSAAMVTPQKLSNAVEGAGGQVPLLQSTIAVGNRSSNYTGSSSSALTTVTAPGSLIRAGWSWGSHAVVSGSSAAAAVAAGAAALTWSNLGQSLGGEASAGAFEGLGQMVRQLMLDSAYSTASSSRTFSDTTNTTNNASSSSRNGWRSSPAQLNLLQAVHQSSDYPGQHPVRV